jgi:hypothetical protein
VPLAIRIFDPLESQMASAEHHGCGEIGYGKSGWR